MKFRFTQIGKRNPFSHVCPSDLNLWQIFSRFSSALSASRAKRAVQTLLIALLLLPSAARSQEIRNVTFGWGNSVRLGRWTPVFITIEDPRTRDVDLQIHGTYGEKGTAMWLHQTAPAQPLPVTYALLFPINMQLSRIEVIISDAKTGQTLGSQSLQNNASFLPAGQVPKRALGTDETLIGISGNVDSALRIQTQLTYGQIPAGVIDPMKLPASFAGYDGINLLILAAADIADLSPDQERAILDWTARGGSLLVIPGPAPLPPKSALLDALPVTLGNNTTFYLTDSRPSSKGIHLNAREATPHPGAQTVDGEEGLKEFIRPWGLGKIAVLPADVSPVDYTNEPTGPRLLWEPLLAPLVKIPPVKSVTESTINDAEEHIIAGPNVAQSVGRGQRESDAIRHVLETLGATGTAPGGNHASPLLILATIFFLIGPVDSIIQMRFGHPPRNWITLAGWLGLIASLGLVAVGKVVSPSITASTFRLVDQVNDSLVGATDIIAVNSTAPATVPLTLDKHEWWEPANQAARSFSPDRFVDANCREDKTGCRPESLRLNGREAQSWHGEAADLGPALIHADLRLDQDRTGLPHLTGKLTNISKATMTDITISTAAGAFIIPGSIALGATADINPTAITNAPSPGNLPPDITDVSPERTDRMEDLMKTGHAILTCQMPDVQPPAVGLSAARHIQLLRAAIPISK